MLAVQDKIDVAFRVPSTHFYVLSASFLEACYYVKYSSYCFFVWMAIFESRFTSVARDWDMVWYRQHFGKFLNLL